MLGLVYFFAFDEAFNRHLITWVVGAGILFTVADAMFIEGLRQFNSYSRTVESIILILTALAFFYQLINRLDLTFIDKQPMFWISVGVLIYFSGNVFLFMLQRAMIASGESDFSLYWIIHSCLNIIANFAYSIAFLCKPPSKL